VSGVGWTVIVKQPLAEAYQPIHAALWRTWAILSCASVLAAILAYWLARRMTGPIQVLRQGTDRIGAGQFEHRIDLRTGDELEQLADSFNAMAAGLAESLERKERIGKLRRFLAPQVAELIDRAGGDELLEGRRTEVVAVFGDLRGFTAFAAGVSPDELMHVLSEYHAVIGRIVTERHATLASYMGDGVMILVNAPVCVQEPVLHALGLAAEMQAAVQGLTRQWRGRGHEIGFGVGLALGPATVGRIGYEGRYDYAVIGSVTNLAARLCAEARDGEVLVDAAAAASAGERQPLDFVGHRHLKGFANDVPVFRLEVRRERSAA
jgi:class 3 adenylate cyclase